MLLQILGQNNLREEGFIILVQVDRKFMSGGEEMPEIPEVSHYNHRKQTAGRMQSQSKNPQGQLQVTHLL